MLDGPTLPHPWPRKPPSWATCDSSVACPTPAECAEKRSRMVDPGSTVHLHRCPKPAVETLWWGHETWVCAEHAEVFETKRIARRNPRRKRS